MWLSGLHIPESYLTAIVQATCRRNGWPLDKSTLFTEVTPFTTADELLDSEEAIGNFIQGLYLEGAGWSVDNNCLVRQKQRQLIQVCLPRRVDHFLSLLIAPSDLVGEERELRHWM